MSIEVYWGSGSTPAWRVLLAFKLKGVPFDSRPLSFSKKEHKSPEFLAINPRGKVPAVRDGDFVLHESLAILAWLDRRFPDRPLFGETPEAHGRIWASVLEFTNHGFPVFSAIARPVFFRREALPAEELHARLPAAHAELDRLAGWVAEGDAVVGDTLTAADVAWYCGARFIDRALSRPRAREMDLDPYPLTARWPALAPWARRIEATPGFAETVPPHWQEGEAPTPVALP